MSLLKEIIELVIKRKKYWLLPIILALFIFGGLLIVSQGSIVAPFIYSLF